MTERGFEVEVQEGISVQLPSGATFYVLTETERDYIHERVSKYLSHNHFCLPAGTMVSTENGPMAIDQLTPDIRVWALGDNGFELHSQRATQVASQPVLTVRTENRILRCSPNHKILTWVTRPSSVKRIGKAGRVPYEYRHEWVQAADLQRGDPIVQAIDLPDIGEDSVPVGRPLTPEFMEFLGFFLGDGTKHGNDRVVRISKKVDAAATAHYVGLLASQSGGLHVYETTGYAEVSSRKLVEELQDLGFWHLSHERYVPQWVFRLNESLRMAFLRGYLDSDGSAQRSGRIQFQASSQSLVQGIWGLCLSLGIPVAPPALVKTPKRDAWRFLAGDPGANKRIGTWDSRYQNYFVNAQPARGRRLANRYGRYLPPPAACEHSRVCSVVVGEEEPLWDLTVEGSHTFIADGVVVHNTNISDFQDIDKMVTFELFIHRWSLWMSKQVDYYNAPIDEKVLAQQVNAYSTELRQLKRNLGIDKVNRDRQRGDDSVAAYLDNLRTRAKEFGIMRDRQTARAIELFQQLQSLITFFDNADAIERQENGVTIEDILEWIRTVAIPEFNEIDSHFRKNNQKAWIRKM